MTSKEDMRYFVPHRVQNIILREYLSRIEETYPLPKTEIKTQNCYPVLKELLADKKIKKIYFYSLEMLPKDNLEVLSNLYERVLEGMTIIFCVEDITLNENSLLGFKEDLHIMQITNRV
ncbi:LIC12192 family sporadic carbohydrate cluster protein [Bacteriovorax sp. Seq25_V]|uniref:LIC12192 family sporadic carbohydrate cluster protein n=1 Tax=Bacteriovorax sp. Seq25_V TaxID=1201288 RepID=UPI0018DFE940|nr:LIC12192 family sporadic carbohydrate cluster protein [Bacteriovorax sp. Seq25_V]